MFLRVQYIECDWGSVRNAEERLRDGARGGMSFTVMFQCGAEKLAVDVESNTAVEALIIAIDQLRRGIRSDDSILVPFVATVSERMTHEEAFGLME